MGHRELPAHPRRLTRSPAASRIEAWFAGRGWTPFGWQRRAWRAWKRAPGGLIDAPTGTGKSYAALFGPLAAWMDAHPGEPPDARARGADPPPIRLLWITPLRALASDLAEGLRAAVDGLGLPWSVEVRTGDTSASDKKRQLGRLPTLLITTPESLSLLLSYPATLPQWRGLTGVVVDEWHELLGTKRGVQTELGLARLRALQPQLRTWGLSATVGNLEEAMEVLLGVGPDGAAPRGRLIRDRSPKRIEIDTVFPGALERFPWSGHLGLKLLPEVVLALEGARTTLLFTNVRSQAEIWYRALLRERPDWEGRIALHHGSVDAARRAEAEEGLRRGALRCVVCTSSLDLGVDFAPVDQVIQIGSPRGIARLVQRAGRSGHRPGEASRILCVPTHALELVEFAAARRAIAAGRMESRRPLDLPLDLLAQHAVTVATGGGFESDALYREVRTTRAFRALDRRAWDWVLEFVATGGATLAAYPRFSRVVESDGRHVVASAEAARAHRMNVGTITSETALDVRYRNGRKLGQVEEGFLALLRPGDAFVFAGKTLEVLRVQETTVWVRPAKRASGRVPTWQGGRMALSSQLAAEILDRLRRAAAGRWEDPELDAVRPLLELQAELSRLPEPGLLLVETTRVPEGHSAFVFPFAGRLAHEGLGALLAWRLSRDAPQSITMTANDYGLELRSTAPIELDAAGWRRLLEPGDLAADLLRCLDAAALARRQFRGVARVAGLVFQGYPGRRKTARQLQSSTGLLYDMFARYDPAHLLLDQARREVLESQLEATRLASALEAIRTMEIRVERTPRLTPLAFPLWAESLQAEHVSSETWTERVRRMVAALERASS